MKQRKDGRPESGIGDKTGCHDVTVPAEKHDRKARCLAIPDALG